MEAPAERDTDRPAVWDVLTKALGGHGEVVADLVDTLRQSAAWEGLSFVAEDGGDLGGHVMFTQSLLDAPRRFLDVQVLSSLAVVPTHQPGGLGSRLVRHGPEVLTARADPMVFL